MDQRNDEPAQRGGHQRGRGNRGHFRGRDRRPPQNDQPRPAPPAAPAVPAQERDERQPQQQGARQQQPGLPAPRHLAQRQTPLRNDPMYLDALVIDGEQGFVQKPRSENFSPSFDSFLPLVRADYLQLSAANRTFQKEVSESMYSYYNIMHLWARVAAVLKHR